MPRVKIESVEGSSWVNLAKLRQVWYQKNYCKETVFLRIINLTLSIEIQRKRDVSLEWCVTRAFRRETWNLYNFRAISLSIVERFKGIIIPRNELAYYKPFDWWKSWIFYEHIRRCCLHSVSFRLDRLCTTVFYEENVYLHRFTFSRARMSGRGRRWQNNWDFL